MNKDKIIFYVLGAGKPHAGTLPSALINISKFKKNFDWILNSSRNISNKLIFISGYKSEKIKKEYPFINIINNPNWRNTGSGFSLLEGLQNHDHHFFTSYSDIIFHNYILNKMNNQKADIILAVDKTWKTRYFGRPKKDLIKAEKVKLQQSKVLKISTKLDLNETDAEFIGLARFSSKAQVKLNSYKKIFSKNYLQKLKLIDLINLLLNEGIKAESLDVQRGWAELNYSFDLSRFMLGTKAETLSRLSGLVKRTKILNQISFNVDEWKKDEENYLKKIQNHFKKNTEITVRSSSLNEDNFNSSNAGKFLTLLNVKINNKTRIKNAIDKVIDSYKDTNCLNQVLIQPMLKKIRSSGVFFTRSIESGSPYYTINIDEETGLTDSITSGTSNSHRTFVINHKVRSSFLNRNYYVKSLIEASKEIQQLVNYDALDIEFAFSENKTLYILQVRPLSIKSKDLENKDDEVFKYINQAKNKFLNYSRKSSKSIGSTNVFGIMPDWNPAEIIGTKPNKLSISLYKYLILDEKWAEQRHQAGYRNLRKIRLLKIFSGHPYIDVRASLNSFIPKDLPDTTAKKLIDSSLNFLKENPELHDKIEFDLLPTCYTFNFEKWCKHFKRKSNISKKELNLWKNLLKEITKKSVKVTSFYFKKIHEINSELELITNNKNNNLEKAFKLFEYSKGKGVIIFAHLARASFISMTLLKSLVEIKVITENELQSFLDTISTISSDFLKDARNCHDGELTFRAFTEKYGHLRPGTYDINSPCYRSNPKKFLRPIVNSISEKNSNNIKDLKNLEVWNKAKAKIGKEFKKHCFQLNIDEIENFFRFAIEGRELSKFYFTKSLSLGLEFLKTWGETKDITTYQLSNLGLSQLKKIKNKFKNNDEIKKFVEKNNKKIIKENQIINQLELPSLITSIRDLYFFEYPRVLPNFVGTKIIIKKCVEISNKIDSNNLKDKIILIPNADPGFDWIFGQKVAGLITMYGGANSHMTIRSVEYNISAAIGVGKLLYDKLAKSKMIELDPKNRNIRIIF